MSTAATAERLAVLSATGKFPEPVLSRFSDFLANAPEEALFRVNPLRYAEEQGLPQRQAIDLFLHATHAGLLGFTWGVLCPACASFITTEPGLKSLARSCECSLCEIPVAPNDDNVEVAFTVAPSVRRIRFHSLEGLDLLRDGLTVFFSGNRVVPPALAERLGQFQDNVVSVGTLPSGRSTVSLELEPGPYGIFVPSQHAWCHLTVAEGEAGEQSLELVEGRFVPRRFDVGGRRASLTIDNRTSRPAVYGVTRRVLPSREVVHANVADYQSKLRPYLTGKMLVTSQTFRDLFRTESIPSESGLEFKSLTVLFTDLKGSTELYERVGDFRAYGLVRQHFDLLREIIAERGGALVKTIGDAVMASFAEPVSALSAATEMNRRIHQLVERGEPLQLKIGLHSGPCIAVELNERLDYFGQTVNIASRVQGEAEASEIVCTEAVYQAPGVRDVVSAAALQVLRDQATLKGVDGQVTVYRMR